MRNGLLAIRLGLEDLLYSRTSFLCQVLGLAALIAPLLILFGIKTGVVSEETGKLLSNPENLSISLARTGQYDEAFIEMLRQDEDVAFVAPMPRILALDADIGRADTGIIDPARPVLLPSGPGDPYLPEGSRAPQRGELYLTIPVAANLDIEAGDSVFIQLSRKLDGNQEYATLDFSVMGLIGANAWGKSGALMHSDDLFDIQLWRDQYLIESFGDTGKPLPVRERVYPKARIYAKDVQAALSLNQRLAEQGVEVSSSLRSVISLNRLDRALSISFFIITFVAIIGYAASFGAALWANVMRKTRALSLLRLGGFCRSEVALFPIAQATFIAACGWGLAAALYLAVAFVLDDQLRLALGLTGQASRLEPLNAGLSALICVLVAWLASSGAAWAATRIDPADGIGHVQDS